MDGVWESAKACMVMCLLLAEKAAERDYGFVRLNQLPLEHLVG